MRRRAAGVALAVLAVVAALAVAAPAQAAKERLNAYEVREDLQALASQGFDMTEARAGGSVEVVATQSQAAAMPKAGLRPRLKRDAEGLTAVQADAAAQRPDGSYDVYRPYFDDTFVGTDDGTPGGTPRPTLYEELQALAAAHPDISRPWRSGAPSTTCRSWR